MQRKRIFKAERVRGIVLLAAAASLSVMAALGLSMLSTTGVQLGQSAQLMLADQARRNAESGYFFALAAARQDGLAMARATWHGNTVAIPGGVGGFRLEFVDVNPSAVNLAQTQIIFPGDDLIGVSLPSGVSSPRLQGTFEYNGVAYRYDSFEAEAGRFTNVRPVDAALSGPLVFDPFAASLMTTTRTDIRAVGMVEDKEVVFTRQVEERQPPPCNLPWGGQIQVGESVTAFLQDSVACGAVCQSETRVCSAVRLPPRSPLIIEYDSVLSGSFTASSCSLQACGCTLPPRHFGLVPRDEDWPTSIGHGESRLYWRENEAPAGQSCASEMRTCTDGNLSGSFTYRICLVQGSFSHDVAPAPRGERSVNDILTDLYGTSMGIRRNSDYGAWNDQVWHNPGSIVVTFLARYAGDQSEFGFLRGLEGNDFVSVFPAPPHSKMQLDFRPSLEDGRVLTQAETGEYFRFAIRNTRTGDIWSSRVRDNWDGVDHIITFGLGENSLGEPIRVLAFEDLPYGGDLDHNDLLIEVRGARLAGIGPCEGCQ